MIRTFHYTVEALNGEALVTEDRRDRRGKRGKGTKTVDGVGYRA